MMYIKNPNVLSFNISKKPNHLFGFLNIRTTRATSTLPSPKRNIFFAVGEKRERLKGLKEELSKLLRPPDVEHCTRWRTFAGCLFSIYSDHQWANIGTLVGWAWEWQFCIEEGLSLLVVCAVTQELHTVGVHLHLCCSMWKSLQAPNFYGSCGKMQRQQGWVMLERPLPSPPLVLLAARSRWRRSTAPTLLASLCQVLQLESSWADRGYMVLQQPSRLKTPTEGSLPLVYLKGKQFEPPLTILLISRNNLTSQMERLQNLLGLFDKFSW